MSLSNSDKTFLISVEDLDLLAHYSWSLDIGGYVQSNNGRVVKLHRLITNCPRGLVVHHKDNNPLNNTRDNLECVKQGYNVAQQNKQANTYSRFKGVTFCRRRNKWIARVRFNYDLIFGGYFDTEEEAGLKAKEMYRKHNGKFDERKIN